MSVCSSTHPRNRNIWRYFYNEYGRKVVIMLQHGVWKVVIMLQHGVWKVVIMLQHGVWKVVIMLQLGV